METVHCGGVCATHGVTATARLFPEPLPWLPFISTPLARMLHSHLRVLLRVDQSAIERRALLGAQWVRVPESTSGTLSFSAAVNVPCPLIAAVMTQRSPIDDEQMFV